MARPRRCRAAARKGKRGAYGQFRQRRAIGQVTFALAFRPGGPGLGVCQGQFRKGWDDTQPDYHRNCFQHYRPDRRVGLTRASYPPIEVLLSDSKTVLGEELAYTDGRAKITAAIVTMLPGEETGWHRHEAPLFARVLEGEITSITARRAKRHSWPGRAFLRRSRAITMVGIRGKNRCASSRFRRG